MFKYWLKNRFLLSTISCFISISIISFFFLSSSMSNIAKAHSETSLFIGSSIDFDIPSPSENQVSEITLLKHIEKVIPYFYTTKSLVYNDSSSISNIGMIFFDDFEDLESTMYNDRRLIEKNDIFSDNPLIVDYRFIKETKLNLGDTVKVNFGGTLVDFRIDAIYETNTYYQNFTVLGIWKDLQKDLTESRLGKPLNYSGAYVVSSNVARSNLFFENEYKPYGRLRDRDEFISDDAYEIHYNAFMSANYSNEITNFDDKYIVAVNKFEEYSRNANVNLVSGVLLLLLIHAGINISYVFRKSEIKYFKSKKRFGSKYSNYFMYSSIFEMIFSLGLFAIYFMIFLNGNPVYLPLESLTSTILAYIIALIIGSTISFFGNSLIVKKAN